MAFKRITLMDIYEIIRRWHAGQKIAHIAKILKYDRKTVRHYIRLAKSMDISKEKSLPEKHAIFHIFKDITFKGVCGVTSSKFNFHFKRIFFI